MNFSHEFDHCVPKSNKTSNKNNTIKNDQQATTPGTNNPDSVKFAPNSCLVFCGKIFMVMEKLKRIHASEKYSRVEQITIPEYKKPIEILTYSREYIFKRLVINDYVMVRILYQLQTYLKYMLILYF